MNRTQVTLAGLLLVQLVVILLVRSPFAGPAGATGPHPLLVGLGEGVVPARVALEGEERSITLTRGETGWAIDELQGFPADAQKVSNLLDDLRELSVRRPLVTSPRYHDSFEVSDEDNEGRVKIWSEKDDVVADLILGSSPGYRLLHVRLGGEDAVYETRGLSSYDLRADSAGWIAKHLVDSEGREIVRFSLKNEHGSFELSRVEDGWQVVAPAALAGRALDPDAVDAMVSGADSLVLADGVGPVDEEAHGFGKAATVVRLEFSNGEQGETGAEVTLRLGAQTPGEEGRRYVTREGFAFTGTIWDSSVSKWLDARLDTLLASATPPAEG